MTQSSFAGDGIIPTGSFDITVYETGDIFTLNSFSISDSPAASITTNHADGSPKSSKEIAGFITGSCDVQLPNEDTIPQRNQTFTVGGHSYYFKSVDEARESQGEFKCSANIQRCVNPLITEPVVDVALTQSEAMTQIDSAATGPESGLTYAWSASGLPSGVSIDAGNGEITGTPDTVETTTAVIKVTATDSQGKTRIGARNIKFTVTA